MTNRSESDQIDGLIAVANLVQASGGTCEVRTQRGDVPYLTSGGRHQVVYAAGGYDVWMVKTNGSIDPIEFDVSAEVAATFLVDECPRRDSNPHLSA